MKGFVYIMSNPSLRDGMLKLGKTSKHPDSFRRRELKTTGVPEDFKVEYSALVEDYDSVEKEAHKKLSRHRNTKNREFFNLDLSEAITEIRSCIGTRMIHEELSITAEMTVNVTGKLEIPDGSSGKKTILKFKDSGDGYSKEDYFANGILKRRVWVYLGKENGMVKEFRSDGSMRRKGHMFNGMKQRRWTSYTRFGQEIRYFDEGKPVMEWETFNDKGELVIQHHGQPSIGYEGRKWSGKPKEKT